MTIQEIKELVSKKIAGQGSQVDIGGALAEILNGIVELLPGPTLIHITGDYFANKSKSEAITLLGITPEQFDNLFKGEYFRATIDAYSMKTFVVLVDRDDSFNKPQVCFCYANDADTEMTTHVFLRENTDGTYSFTEL